MLNYEMPPLFIEIGILKKIREKRMGENPKKKKRDLVKSKLIFRSEPVSYFDHISLLKILINLKF